MALAITDLPLDCLGAAEVMHAGLKVLHWRITTDASPLTPPVGVG